MSLAITLTPDFQQDIIIDMAQAPTERKYELAVFGATGYTGRLVCEEVLANTPSTLKWAIAGRSPNKLELLAIEYNRRFPDRIPVGMNEDHPIGK